MSLDTAVISFDISDLVGADFDASKVRAWTTTNADGNRLLDTAANLVRMGDGKATVAADGTGSFSVWVPGADGNPSSWQQTFYFEHPLPGSRGRTLTTFGPYTIAGSANLADLDAEQGIPPTYLSEVSGALQGFVDDAEAARDDAEEARDAAAASAAEAHDISNIDTPDALVATLIDDPDSDTATSLSASIADGAGYARVNLVCDGDSNFIGGNGQVPLIYKIHTQIAEGMANTTARNFGVSGQTLADMLSDAVAQIDSLIDNTPGTLNLLVVGGGGNDLNEGSHPTAATIYARKVAYHAARRAAGWTTIDLTVLPRSLAASYGSGYETQRAALNTLIRTNWADYADGFVDSDAVPGLGTVADVADARVWADENLHISSLGVSRLVDAIKPEVARLGALTGQRQPVNRIPSGSLFIPATAFRPMSGTAPNAGEAPAASWMFPDTGTTNVLAGIEIPREWKRLRIYVWWSPYGSDGNVSHFVSLTPLVLGGDWYLGGGSAAGVGIGIGQNKVVRSQMASSPLLGSSAPTSWSVGYGRNVGDTANDTHTNSMLFLGVELVDHPLDGE